MTEEVKKKPRGRRKKVKEAKKYAIPDDLELKNDMIQSFITENMKDDNKYIVFPAIKE
jgi:hypothetical protein